MINDKKGVLNDIDGKSLDLGCGPRRRFADYIGIDALDYPTVDIVGDVFDVFAQIPDGTIQNIYSEHFMEHIEDVETLLNEFVRVLKVGGEVTIIVPHWSNPYFYSDLTHRHAWGLYSMSYFCGPSFLKRKVPFYQRERLLDLVSVHLDFKSSPPFYFRHAWKKAWGLLANLRPYTLEFYEENLATIVPAYQITFVARKRTAQESTVATEGDVV